MKWLKNVSLLLFVSLFVSCSSKNTNMDKKSDSNQSNISIIFDVEDINTKNALKPLIDDYCSKLQYSLNINYKIKKEGDSYVPDLFFTYDSIAFNLLKQSKIERIPEQYQNKIKERDNSIMLKAFRKSNSINLFPVCFSFGEMLYYDSSFYNQNEVKKWESIIGTNLSLEGSYRIGFNSLSCVEYFGAFSGNGLNTDFVFDEEGLIENIYDNLNSEIGLDICKALSTVLSYGCVDFDLNNTFSPEKQYSAFLSDASTYPLMREYFGDNLEIANIPSLTYESKILNWSHSLDSKGLAITKTDDEEKRNALFDLAFYLSGEEGQKVITSLNQSKPFPTNSVLLDRLDISIENEIQNSKDFASFPINWAMICEELFAGIKSDGGALIEEQLKNNLNNYHNSVLSLIN